jgi:hypothetical protein
MAGYPADVLQNCSHATDTGVFGWQTQMARGGCASGTPGSDKSAPTAPRPKIERKFHNAGLEIFLTAISLNDQAQRRGSNIANTPIFVCMPAAKNGAHFPKVVESMGQATAKVC